MCTGNRRKHSNLYTKEQIQRVITGSGIEIQSEVDSDYIIFCPFHNNSRSPAGEVDKSSGFFFCFSCQHVCDLVELIMHTSGRTYFESARYIKSKETESDIEQAVSRTLQTKPEYTQYDQVLIKRLNQQALESPRAMRYYSGRLITESSVKKFQLGFSEKQDMVCLLYTSPSPRD